MITHQKYLILKLVNIRQKYNCERKENQICETAEKRLSLMMFMLFIYSWTSSHQQKTFSVQQRAAGGFRGFGVGYETVPENTGCEYCGYREVLDGYIRGFNRVVGL